MFVGVVDHLPGLQELVPALEGLAKGQRCALRPFELDAPSSQPLGPQVGDQVDAFQLGSLVPFRQAEPCGNGGQADPDLLLDPQLARELGTGEGLGFGLVDVCAVLLELSPLPVDALSHLGSLHLDQAELPFDEGRRLLALQLVVPVVGELALITNAIDGDVDVDASLIPVHDQGMGEAFQAHVFEVALHVPTDLLIVRILGRGIGQAVVQDRHFDLGPEPPDEPHFGGQVGHRPARKGAPD